MLFLSPKQQNNTPTSTAIPDDDLFNNPGAFLFTGLVLVVPFRFLVSTLHVSFFELTLLDSQHRIFFSPCNHLWQRGFVFDYLLAPTDGSWWCFSLRLVSSSLKPLFNDLLLSLSLFFLLSCVFLTNSLPVYMTILEQRPHTYPKPYKINIFRTFSFFSLTEYCDYYIYYILILEITWSKATIYTNIT